MPDVAVVLAIQWPETAAIAIADSDTSGDDELYGSKTRTPYGRVA
jgi:hypothetical protein